MRNTYFGLLLIVLSILFPIRIMADQRSYVWTYEYLTVPRGDAEFETYFTISSPDKSKLKGNSSTEHKFEIEVGMTDRFDFAIYHVFSQAPEEAFKYDGFQLRARYRIGEKDKYLMDPLIYLEYRGVPDFAEHGLEAKLILAKDIDNFNISFNPIVEVEFGDENEIEPEYALGMSYRFDDLLRIGIEAKGNADAYYIGPVVSHGKGRFWVTLGSAFNLGTVEKGKSEFELRMLLGIGL